MRQRGLGNVVWLIAVACGAAGAVATDADKPAAAARPRMEPMDPSADQRPGRRPAAGTVAYLGIATGPVSEELRAHADLPERGGLLITRVAAGSPAARAGLEPRDILLAFDGRDVTSPLELTEMVEAAGDGATVTLDILRRGKRREVKVVLEARAAAAGLDGRPAAMAGGLMPGLDGLPAELREKVEAAIAHGMAEGMAQAQVQAGGGGGANVRVRTFVLNGRSESTAASSDEQGTIEIRSRDGKKTVSICDPDGTEIHAGPLDDEADYEAIPEAWRQKVRGLDERSSDDGRPARPAGGAI